jgi:hypothetical protein
MEKTGWNKYQPALSRPRPFNTSDSVSGERAGAGGKRDELHSLVRDRVDVGYFIAASGNPDYYNYCSAAAQQRAILDKPVFFQVMKKSLLATVVD